MKDKTKQSRSSFVFHLEWAEILQEYPPEVRLEVYDAIIGYAQSGTLSELKPLSTMAFSFIKKKLDSDFAKYDETISRRSEAGKKSAASRTINQINKCQQSSTKSTSVEFVEQNQQMSTKSTNVSDVEQCQQTSTKSTDNDYVYDYVYDIKKSTDVDTKNPPPPPEFGVYDLRPIDDIVAELKNPDTEWMDLACAKFSKTSEEICDLLSEFGNHCKLNGNGRKTFKDAVTHFNNWLRQKTTQPNEILKSDRYDKRRATDAGSNKPKNYKATF